MNEKEFQVWYAMYMHVMQSTANARDGDPAHAVATANKALDGFRVKCKEAA